MKLTRGRRFSIQMQQYETYAFEAIVEMSHIDIGYSDVDLLEYTKKELVNIRDELTEAVLKELETQLIDEINDCVELTASKKSYILRMAGVEEAPKRKPIRRRR